ncbi:glycosyltransferase family 2 protein [Phyllobacterium ifriqiyense]|uniref:glycosyltransferase family 2 protein n=1 Tax=Phyllobacterium ifriqiyense TaxID=314238 RepID=UPI0033917EA0
MTLVSVIIPSYNHAIYISTAVESVLTQSETDLELIVVDDGSKDDSVEFLRSISDSRFKLFEQENAGAHNAINRGLSVAKGDYVAILNSDDVFHPDRIGRCIQECRDTGADLVSTWIEVIDSQGKTLGVKEGWRNMLPWQIPDYETSFASVDDFELNLLVSNFVSTTSNILMTRKLLNEVGAMRNLRFAHDWDFLLRASSKFKCSLLEEPLLQYRVHGSNTISSNRRWMLFEICWVLATGMRRIESNRLYQSPKPADWSREAWQLHNSINLQGNDKVYWLIRQFIDAKASQGVEMPELLLIDNIDLRDDFVQMIVDETKPRHEVAEKPSPSDRFKSLLRRYLSI